MKTRFFLWGILCPFIFTLTGCQAVGDKTASLSVIYGVTAALSLLLLLGYITLVRKKEPWLLVLFASVSVVNAGYFWLSVAGSLQAALMANRVSYLGSVFLPTCMLMSVLRLTRMRIPRWLPLALVGGGVVMFLIAASPGILDIYYKEVSLSTVNGVTVLQKVYGPLHSLYLFYLLFYFAAMVAVILHAKAKNKISSPTHGVILLVAVLVNIGVWLLEQLVHLDFEFLSVSYIISELFLLALYLMMQEAERLAAPPVPQTMPASAPVSADRQAGFLAALPLLTNTERKIYDLYLEGKSTKEVLAALNITENTLKYHNKNLYSKLGVSSRKQLIEIGRGLPTE